MAGPYIRRDLNRSYLLQRETAEKHEAEIKALEEEMAAIQREIVELDGKVAQARKTMESIAGTIQHRYPDWTPEGARAELPFVTIRKPKDMTRRASLMEVLKAARKPMTVTEIATRMRKIRGEEKPTDYFLNDRLNASLSTMLRRGRETIFVEHAGRPARWSLRRRDD